MKARDKHRFLRSNTSALDTNLNAFEWMDLYFVFCLI